MALLVLILTGALMGWLASIITRVEHARGVLAFLGVGMLACLLGGLTMNNGGVLGGLNLMALGVGVVASIVLLAGYWTMFVRRT